MTLDEVINLAGSEIAQELRALAEKAAKRGDGIAVYRNEDMSSIDLGHMQFMTYGSPAAMIEQAEPPQTLPDIGSQINWRYQLVGTWKGDA